MINNQEFTKRLEQVLKYYDLPAFVFADKIGVQRSSISHLLSGRNKPSLDFVMRVVSSFPEVDLYWLLYGKGSFPKRSESEAPTATQAPLPKETFEASPEPASKIEKIIIFYTDGSFKAYTDN
ncbi:helix-turn-helix transcriptional regulator [Arenibacter amylolyticus]|uniref:helix-turn-helix transcriptional regulator n=1 Tax=Arenibacter amylolyticus TaxID=1406873 RepID=UPI000A3B8A29|nr:helix-turn-helix transcriptional regulator [Arenibacter amylolyticus]